MPQSLNPFFDRRDQVVVGGIRDVAELELVSGGRRLRWSPMLPAGWPARRRGRRSGSCGGWESCPGCRWRSPNSCRELCGVDLRCRRSFVAGARRRGPGRRVPARDRRRGSRSAGAAEPSGLSFRSFLWRLDAGLVIAVLAPVRRRAGRIAARRLRVASHAGGDAGRSFVDYRSRLLPAFVRMSSGWSSLLPVGPAVVGSASISVHGDRSSPLRCVERQARQPPAARLLGEFVVRPSSSGSASSHPPVRDRPPAAASPPPSNPPPPSRSAQPPSETVGAISLRCGRRQSARNRPRASSAA